MLVGQRIQLDQLFVSDHVTGRVGRARDANHPRLFRDLQVFKIDVVFKLAFWQQLNIRAGGDKQILFETRVGVADIFRRQREQDFAGGAIRTASGKEVKQVENAL